MGQLMKYAFPRYQTLSNFRNPWILLVRMRYVMLISCVCIFYCTELKAIKQVNCTFYAMYSTDIIKSCLLFAAKALYLPGNEAASCLYAFTAAQVAKS
jgi:hypothetical protein